jgi:hypothetical protein
MLKMARGSKGVIEAGTEAQVRGEDRVLTIRAETPATFVTDSFSPGENPGQGMILVRYGSLQVYVPERSFTLPKNPSTLRNAPTT